MNDASEAKSPINSAEAHVEPASSSHSPSHSRRSASSRAPKNELDSIVADSPSHGRNGSGSNSRRSRSYGSTDSAASRSDGDGGDSPSVEPKKLSASASESEDEESLKRQKRQWMYILPMICIGMFGIMTIIPNLPDILAETFTTDLSIFVWSGIADSGNALLSFLASPWLGRMSDATGRNKIMFLSTMALLLPFAAVGVGLNAWWYVGLRIACGIFAVNVSIALAYIADVSPRDKRSGRYGMALALMSLAVIVGSLAGATAPFNGIRWAAPIIVILVAAYVLFVLPESLSVKNRIPLEEARKYHNPITNVKVLRTGGSTAGLTAMLALSGFADAGFQATTYIYLSVRFGWDAQKIGSWTAAGAAISALHAGMLRYYVRRWHERTVILGSLALTFIGYVLYGIANQDYQLYAFVVLTSMRYVLQPAASSLIAQEVGPDRKGTILATSNAVRDFFSITGPFAFGALSGALQSAEHETARSFHFFLGAAFYFFSILVTWKYTSTEDFSYRGGSFGGSDESVAHSSKSAALLVDGDRTETTGGNGNVAVI